jgi:2-oxoglutarate ferredoxin oxidoreductase subunit gamma
MADYYEMRLAGLGGQGLILAGIIVAEAAGVYEGKEVVQTQAYGAETRGGFSRSDIVISDEEILYPKASELDFLLVMSQSAYEEHAGSLKKNGVLLLDSTYVSKVSGERTYAIPFSKIAQEKFGRENVANIMALGAITQVFSAISQESMEKAVLNRVPPRFIDLNKNAFKEGVRLGKKMVKAASREGGIAEEEEV